MSKLGMSDKCFKQVSVFTCRALKYFFMTILGSNDIYKTHTDWKTTTAMFQTPGLM